MREWGFVGQGTPHPELLLLLLSFPLHSVESKRALQLGFRWVKFNVMGWACSRAGFE